jgi:hypothetical protein
MFSDCDISIDSICLILFGLWNGNFIESGKIGSRVMLNSG